MILRASTGPGRARSLVPLHHRPCRAPVAVGDALPTSPPCPYESRYQLHPRRHFNRSKRQPPLNTTSSCSSSSYSSSSYSVFSSFRLSPASSSSSSPYHTTTSPSLLPSSRPHPSRSSVRRYVPRPPDAEPEAGTATPSPDDVRDRQARSTTPFYFEAGYALFAKRPSRPFPPPFASKPSSSFSDPLSTHDRNVYKRREKVNGEMIRGVTNGDDAVLVSPQLIVANDGVGAWAQKERGHAGLWSRLILHFWALEAEKDGFGASSTPDPKAYLQRAFELTKEATSKPNEWFGTTTASGALLASVPAEGGEGGEGGGAGGEQRRPRLYVTQLGDSQVLVIRPRTEETLFTTEEQWHWFDCPRQLGTNSPDTPDGEAVVDEVDLEVDDVVLAMSDGVVDNLWPHEIVANVLASMKRFEERIGGPASGEQYAEGMKYVASELVKAATVIAKDPFAESPFMERAVEEGLPTEGGKMDDISVVAAICVQRKKSETPDDAATKEADKPERTADAAKETEKPEETEEPKVTEKPKENEESEEADKSKETDKPKEGE